MYIVWIENLVACTKNVCYSVYHLLKFLQHLSGSPVYNKIFSEIDGIDELLKCHFNVPFRKTDFIKNSSVNLILMKKYLKNIFHFYPKYVWRNFYSLRLYDRLVCYGDTSTSFFCFIDWLRKQICYLYTKLWQMQCFWCLVSGLFLFGVFS